MSNNVAIKVEGLSKKYIIKHEKKSAHYETFSETLIQAGKSFAKKIIHPFSGTEIDSHTQEEFYLVPKLQFWNTYLLRFAWSLLLISLIKWGLNNTPLPNWSLGMKKPNTIIQEGIRRFVEWSLEKYNGL